MKALLIGAQGRMTALAVLMLVLLCVLAALQYRWTGQLGIAEREQMRVNVQSAVVKYAADFDRELTRVLLYFLTNAADDEPLGVAVVKRYDYWAEKAPHPELVKAVYLARRPEPDDSGGMQLERFDVKTRQFEPVAWSDAFTTIRLALEAPDPDRRDRRWPSIAGPVFAEAPALVLPLGQRSSQVPGRRMSGPRGRSSAAAASAFAILELDRDYIVEVLLPLLTERHFGDGNYRLVVQRSGQPDGADSASQSVVVYQSNDGRADGREGVADATAPLLGLLPGREFPTLLLEAGHSPREFEAPGRRGGGRRVRPPMFPGGPRDGSDKPWLLTATHRSGSLEAAIAAVRFRNLFISFGILLLMAGSVALILLSAKRAQDLARQKMEFVAGVSHELRTPLAVICSAGQNLADGVTDDPGRVRDYGKLIRDEGRRLADMVAQVLEHAAVQSGRKSYSRARVNITDVVETALADCETLIDEGGFTVDKSYADALPGVDGDAEALRRAVQNLIVNAIKYAGEQAWIGVRVAATPTSGGGDLSIAIEDRGKGIEASERERIFEPFFRGAAAVAEQIHGNGLGLSLVQQIARAHGGRVSVTTSTSDSGHGSTFTLHLPAAASALASESADRRDEVDGELGQHARG